MDFIYSTCALLCLLSIDTCLGRNRRRHESDKASHVTKETPQSRPVSDVISDVCLSKGRDRLVYRFQNETNIFIGFDVVKKNVLYTMRWKMTDKKGEKLVDENSNKGDFDKVDATTLRTIIGEDALLAITGRRQQRQFKEGIQTCITTGNEHIHVTRSCILQSLAARADAMRSADFSKNCGRAKRRKN